MRPLTERSGLAHINTYFNYIKNKKIRNFGNEEVNTLPSSVLRLLMSFKDDVTILCFEPILVFSTHKF